MDISVFYVIQPIFTTFLGSNTFKFHWEGHSASAFLTFNVRLISNAISGIFIRLAMNFFKLFIFFELSTYV